MGRDERGATAVEYGLIAGLVSIGIVGALIGTRGSLNTTYGAISSQMGSATTPKPPAGDPTLAAASPTWGGKVISSVQDMTATNGMPYKLITFKDGSYAKASDAYKYYNPSDQSTTSYQRTVVMVDGSNPTRTITQTLPADGTSQAYTYQTSDYNQNGVQTGFLSLSFQNPTSGTADGITRTYDSTGKVASQQSVSYPASNYAQSVTDTKYLYSIGRTGN